MGPERRPGTSTLDIDRPPASVTEAELVDALAGQSTRFERVEALHELRRRSSPRLLELLVQMVGDGSAPSELRTAIIVVLGEVAEPEREQALMAMLGDPDASVVRRAAAALGRIGTQAALERLRALEPPGSRGVRQAVEFAKVLISYRLSLGQHRLAPLPPGELLTVVDPAPFQVEPADPELLKRLAPQLRAEVPAIHLFTASGLSITCQGAQLLVLLTDEAVRPEGQESAGKDMVAGIVLKRYSTGSYRLLEYLLMHPVDGRALLFGVEASGILVHVGEARLHATGAQFELRAVNTVHSPPIDVAGEYHRGDRRLVLTRGSADVGPAPNQKRPAMAQRASVAVPPRVR